MTVRSKDLLPYLVLAGAVAIVYANIYGNEFVADDKILIAYNPVLRSWHYWPAVFTKTLAPGCPYYRPLHGLINLILYQIAGASLIAFHLPNVLLHAANACLVYVLGRRMRFAAVPVFLAALLWAVHPIQTETVTQMSGLADGLFSFFCLLGVIVLFPDFSRRRIGLAALCMALGLMSKEAAVVFPLLALLCFHYAQKGRRWNLRAYLRFWPFVLVAFVYTIIWIAVLFSIYQPSYVPAGASQPQSFNYALLGAPFYYLKMFFWPRDLYMEHDLPVYAGIGHAAVYAGIALAVAGLVQVLRPQSKSSWPLSWGICWFVAAQFLTIFFPSDKIYEHWLYLPSAGLLLGLFQSVYLMAESTPMKANFIAPIGIVVALALAPVLGFLTWQQNHVWKDGMTLYGYVLKHAGVHTQARAALGLSYKEAGYNDKAIGVYKYIVTHADESGMSKAGLATVQADWGEVLLAMPKTPHSEMEAQLHFETALTFDPDCYLALNDLADYYMQRGDMMSAATYRKKADVALKKMPIPQDTGSP